MRLKYWHAHIVSSAMFIGWAVYQLTFGHNWGALAFDIVAAGAYFYFAYSRRKREEA